MAGLKQAARVLSGAFICVGYPTDPLQGNVQSFPRGKGKMIRYLENDPTGFTPETVRILSDALDEAWRRVETDKASFKVDGNAEGAREMLAKHIFDMAQRGERNPQRLILGALARLRL